jgi:hypothetical protein
MLSYPKFVVIQYHTPETKKYPKQRRQFILQGAIKLKKIVIAIRIRMSGGMRGTLREERPSHLAPGIHKMW